MFSSLRWRIAVAYSCLMLTGLISLTLYLLSYVDSSIFGIQTESLMREAVVAADLAEQRLVARPDGTDLNDLAARLKAQLGVRVTFIRADGFVWADSDEDPRSMENHSNRPEFRQALETGSGASVRESTTVGYSMVYEAVPLKVGGVTAGVGRLAKPAIVVDNITSHIRETAGLVGLFVGGLSVLLAIYLARAVTAPVDELVEAANRLATGDLNNRIITPGKDEVGVLAGAFNRMAEALKISIEDIIRERNQAAAVLTHMVDASIVVEADGRVGLLNPAAWKLLDRAPIEVEGRTFTTVVRDHQLVSIYRACLEAGGAQQERYIELGQQNRFVRVVAVGIPSQEGMRMLILAEDLSELRRLEAVRRDFVANASHELRTPLASLRAVVDTLEIGVDDPSQVKEYLKQIQIETDRLTQMTNELIELSRIESGHIGAERQLVDLNQVLQTVFADLRPQAERSHLTLEVAFQDELPKVQADADQLQTVLTNLIHNAIKYTPSGGAIQARVFVSDSAVGVQVTDTGVGISEEDLPRIFERFYKGDKSRSTGGTGLGLAIARHIVQAHGGHIWVKSVEGRGATFTFDIPLN
jgi:two-component system, OmpR family, phosphate regulon sensor histidine kinase PhoR